MLNCLRSVYEIYVPAGEQRSGTFANYRDVVQF